MNFVRTMRASATCRLRAALLSGASAAALALALLPGMAAPAHAEPSVQVTDAARAALSANAPLIERLARVNAPQDGAAGKGMIAVATPGASFALPIGDVIDVAAETARLDKNAAKISKDADGLRKRLDNPKFVENADFEVIEETRQKLADLDEDLARINAAVAQLKAM